MKRILRSILDRLPSALRPVLRYVADALPASGSGREGALAAEGGRPVRDVRLRPWATASDDNRLSWRTDIRSTFREIYVGGVEGLPQPHALRFADEWARFCGAKHGLLVGHGTDALRVALAAVLEHDGLSHGGEIIVPNLSFIASATAALDRRFGVALVDVDPATLLLDPDRVEEAIVPGLTRAIMPVHLFGQPADMTRLCAVARKHGLRIIEDAAQAHGAAWSGQRVGSFGDAAAFSFQSSKVLASGEGGALVTSDDGVFERAYSIQNVGRARQGGSRWDHVTLGWNCRPTEYQAALLLHRLRKFDRQQAVRARNFARLRELLVDSRALTPLAVHPNVDAHAMYMFVMRYRAEHCGGLGIDEFLRIVRAEGVPLHRGFAATISQQPAIRDLATRRADYVRVLETPVADRAARETLYVSHEVFLGGDRDMEDIAAAIRKVERRFSTAGRAS